MAFTGTEFGSVQSTYPNQMGTALIGDLASPLSQSNVENVPVSETDGIKFGLGVVLTPVTSPVREGVNGYQAALPGSAFAEADFGGIVLRTAVGQCDANGNGYVAQKRIAAVAKPNRGGFKVWVKANYSDVAADDDVYLIIKDEVTPAHGFDIGSFSNKVITSGADGTLKIDTVKLTTGKFISNVVNGMALVEFKQ
ncbi:MAG TPA: hypothetical protein DDW84_00215 [Phycisphaerales bacterium]|nr:MAG: hypothetical protein A2Y13_01940 [Planctomycetes bacterium GWC2_45_44]HBG77261.1 hypothetical protein [Phycisphaerales bacterium]HBR19182.1 hypothetical protein [Phycisphaerales bacterium]